MNAITYALKQIRFNIPRQILTDGFTYNLPHIARDMSSLDERIVNNVIVGKVLLDMNVLSGVEELIPLTGLTPQYDADFNVIFKIPPELTDGKVIMNVLGVGSAPLSGGGGLGGGYPQLPINGGVLSGGGCCPNIPSGLGSELGKIFDSLSSRSGSGTDYNAHVQLVGPNTVMITGYRFMNSSNLLLRATLEHDSDLSNLNTRIYDKLGKICVLATKAYIYNELIIPLNEGKLSGGQSLDTYTSIVESYSSASEDYDNYRENGWGVALFSNDKARMDRFVSGMLNINL